MLYHAIHVKDREGETYKKYRLKASKQTKPMDPREGTWVARVGTTSVPVDPLLPSECRTT